MASNAAPNPMPANNVRSQPDDLGWHFLNHATATTTRNSANTGGTTARAAPVSDPSDASKTPSSSATKRPQVLQRAPAFQSPEEEAETWLESPPSASTRPAICSR